jgi:predicted metal-dependent RNase
MLTCIWEIAISKLGQDTYYPGFSFHEFVQPYYLRAIIVHHRGHDHCLQIPYIFTTPSIFMILYQGCPSSGMQDDAVH